jgi:photosystem II stability/assembly factor-like uncharacterized protein
MNGGSNWSVLSSPTTSTITAVYFSDNIGWIGGYNFLYKMTNGGKSWIAVNLTNNGSSFSVLKVKFFD